MKKISRAAFAKCLRLATALAVILPMMAGMAEAAGISGVNLNAHVQFRQFELVHVLNSYFTLETAARTSNPWHTQQMGDRRIVVVL